MSDIQSQIAQRGTEALEQIAAVADTQGLDQIRVNVLGKKGSLSEALKSLGQIPAEERPKIGALANQWKAKIEAAIEAKKTELESVEILASLEKSVRISKPLPVLRNHKISTGPAYDRQKA